MYETINSFMIIPSTLELLFKQINALNVFCDGLGFFFLYLFLELGVELVHVITIFSACCYYFLKWWFCNGLFIGMLVNFFFG